MTIAKKTEHTAATPVTEKRIDSTCKVEGSYDEVVYCSVCDKELSRTQMTIGLKEHTEIIDSAIAPTCTTTGFTEGKHCFVCNTVLVKQEIIPITHDWTTSYSYTKSAHWKKCTKCVATTEKVAHDIGMDGYCKTCDNPITGSEGVLYFLSSDGTYAEVIDYIGDSVRIIIADEYEGVPVTKISNNAFGGKGITSIVIPNSVTSIDKDAFKNCNSLTSIAIPDSVVHIGSSAFEGCINLTNVYITNLFAWCKIEFETRSASPFYYASNLYLNQTLVSQLEIPDGITSITPCMFSGLSCLTSITVPNSVTNIEAGSFSGCNNLESITLPFVGGSIKTSNNTYQYPFGYIFGTNRYTGSVAAQQHYYGSSTSNTTYTTYYIPSSLTSVTITGGNILFGAFLRCTTLTSITIPNSATSIGKVAFEGCTGLKSFTIPNGIISIEDSAFCECRSLTNIIIPNSVTSIGNYAFCECVSLTNITIPNSVTDIGSAAFQTCINLTNITIPDSVMNIGSNAFNGCSKIVETINGISYVGNVLLTFDNSAAIVSIREGTTIISSSAFANATKLRVITLPSGVVRIGSMAFYKCINLTSITIPDSVMSIGSSAFEGCTELTNITFTDTSSWYQIADSLAWSNATGGTEMLLTDASTNATYFKTTYYRHYWYKKQ